MGESFQLKPISRDAIGEALDKAERYRLLNDPEQAESICLDVLAADPGNQRALPILVLSLTDCFSHEGKSPGVARTKAYLSQVEDPYMKAYYAGLIHEREARASLRRAIASVFAYHEFRRAMDHFERAMELRPPGNDDAILRWNSCARTIQRERLRPVEDEGELPLE